MAKKMVRNCGQILGSLKELQPFIYIACSGVSLRYQKARWSKNMKGIFVVNSVSGDGLFPHKGLILPLSRCRDDRTRESLQELHKLLANNKHLSDIGVHYAVIKKLIKDRFGEKLQIAEHASLSGFVPFERTKGLFTLLAENFDYVSEIDDDPNGVAHPTEFQPFSWKSYGEFLEWFHKFPSKEEGTRWNHCYPHIVFDDTGLMDDFWPNNSEITHPRIRLGDYFTIKPNVTNAAITIGLEMHEYGWASLTVKLNEQSVTISLSNVFPPFETMLEWVKRVSRADIPVKFDIDEEGTEIRLSVFSFDDPDRVLLRITDPYGDEDVFVEGIVSRSELVQAFKAEILRFFWKEFDPQHWDDLDTPYPLKQTILSDPWLSTDMPENIAGDCQRPCG